MPKGSPELTEKRINEILNACEKIYTTQGFYGVNIKEISTEISLSRPSIYNYFETKEEILLGLIVREYSKWCDQLEKLIEIAKYLNSTELSDKIAKTLEDKVTLLRILNMNLFEIELNSRVERLAEFKIQFSRLRGIFKEILLSYSSKATDSDLEQFCEIFTAFLFGVFALTTRTEKQIKAMKIANVSFRQSTIYEIIYNCLIKILPPK